MESFNIEVKLIESDIYEFEKTFLFRRLTFKQFVILYSLFAVYVVLQIFTDGIISESTSKNLMLLFMPIVVVGILMLFIKKTSKDMIKAGMLNEKSTIYEFTKDFIGYSSVNGEGKYLWSEFYKIKETEHCFLFYISKQQALILPKRYFDTSNTMPLLRQLSEESQVGIDSHEPWKLFAVSMFILSAAIVAMLTTM